MSLRFSFLSRTVLLLFLGLVSRSTVLAQAGQFDWQTGSVLFPGIRHAALAVQEPRILKINAVQIDLTTPGLSFKASGRDEDWGKPMPDYPSLEIRTRRITTRDFLLQARQRGQNMVLAVNSNGWRPWEKPFNHKYGGKLGLIISDGQLVSEPSRGPSLLVYRDGRVAFAHVAADADLSEVQTAVSGFCFVLEKGEVTNKDKSLHPRTGYGLSEDKRYLIFLTINGRQKGYSEGATTAEVAEWLRHFGAWEGLNMDGGGSTTLVYWDTAAGAVRRVNHQAGGAERRVGCSLGIVLPEEPPKIQVGDGRNSSTTDSGR